MEQVPLTVDTDKVDADIPSPVAGVGAEVLAEPGAGLRAGDPICVIET